uniref:(northern house mosquito) hypothetical protein n=1 Tax=Culex pipiens TaxID=7175 RepID=A0A8D8MU52_CULPI
MLVQDVHRTVVVLVELLPIVVHFRARFRDLLLLLDGRLCSPEVSSKLPEKVKLILGLANGRFPSGQVLSCRQLPSHSHEVCASNFDQFFHCHRFTRKTIRTAKDHVLVDLGLVRRRRIEEKRKHTGLTLN